jgi:hypothetical protein
MTDYPKFHVRRKPNMGKRASEWHQRFVLDQYRALPAASGCAGSAGEFHPEICRRLLIHLARAIADLGFDIVSLASPDHACRFDHDSLRGLENT